MDGFNSSEEPRLWAGLRAGIANLRRAAGGPGRQDGPVNLRRLLALLRAYRARMTIALSGVLASALLTLTGPKVLSYMVNAIVPGGDPSNLGKATLVLIGLFGAQGLLSVCIKYQFGVVGLRMVMELRLRLFAHLQRLPLAFYAERRTGELVSRVMNDVTTVRVLLTEDVAGVLRQVTVFLGALIMIIVTEWRLTLLMFLLVPSVTIISTLFGRVVRRISTRMTDEVAATTTVLEEAISGVRTVRSFVREAHETGRFQERLGRLLSYSLEVLYLEVLLGPWLAVMLYSSTIIILWFGGKQVLAGNLSPGDLVMFITLTGRMGEAISWFGGLWSRLQGALGASRRFFELVDEPPDMPEAPDALNLPAIAGRITFEELAFTYRSPAADPDDSDHAVRALEGISLDVEPGEILAIVGPSGAGKTTLLNLVPRFYDPELGRMLIDGVDVRTVRVASLRRQIAIVPQETHLFGGTIRENVLYGDLDATEEEMEQAARAANAHDFIVQQPRGYDSVVGERGVKLSGGQRQRLAIARALLKNPRVLLLDEATSALDSESENLVQEALQRLMAGRTTLVIAHRLSTVKNAHRIAVLDSGRLVELGTHNELLAEGKLYARLYRHQFQDVRHPDVLARAT